MARATLTPRPGWLPGATPADSAGGWWDMSQVRFVNRSMQPIGGWTSCAGFKLADAVRQIESWRDLTRLRWGAAASLSQIKVWDGNAAYDITPPDFVAGTPGGQALGYGIGAYGSGPYGTRRTPGTVGYQTLPGDTVNLDNWGENLVVSGSADGRILWWVPTAGSAGAGLVPVPPATPTPEEAPGIVHVVPKCLLAFVTDERFLVAVGANGDARQVAWSDQERPGAWTPDVTNLCGSLELNTTGIPRMARRTPFGPIIWCDDDVHQMTFLGPPDAYGIRRLATGCSAIGPNATIATAQSVAWMGQSAFWMYYGGVPMPIPCPVQQIVFDNINRDSQGRTAAAFNGLFPEMWWFYPDTSSVEPNRYVVWNFQTNAWYGGALTRTGLCEPAAFERPLMGDDTGQVYEHESGWSADGTPRGTAVYAESGDVIVGSGDRAAYIAQLQPDFSGDAEPQWHLFGRWEPEDIEEDWGVFDYTRQDGLIDVDQEARRVRFRIENIDPPDIASRTASTPPWVLGQIGADVRPGAGR
jgi:hypothetical protein